MSTKSSIKYREQADDTPGFRLYDDALDDGDSPPVYLRLDGVAVQLVTADGGASVTATLPREMAQALGLLAAQPASGTAEVQPTRTVEQIARSIWAIQRENEDRCDMELEDMGKSHSVWDEARAVHALLNADQPATGAKHD